MLGLGSDWLLGDDDAAARLDRLHAVGGGEAAAGQHDPVRARPEHLGRGCEQRICRREHAAHGRAVVSAGYPVIADGTFLRADERQRFRALAEELKTPFAIVDFAAPADTLRARVERRRLAARDASEADVPVLEHQLQTAEALTASERARAVTCEGGTQSVHCRLLDVLALRDRVRHG